MLKFLISSVSFFLLFTSATTYQEGFNSAASAAQIRFAIEQKYDDTGPEAKNPVYAYKTYKTLDEALVAYLDDPDTKLPEKEKSKAIEKLTKTSEPYNSIFENYRPKLTYKPEVFDFPTSNVFYRGPSTQSFKGFSGFKENSVNQFQSLHGVPSYNYRNSEFVSSPQYTYSYGVNNEETGDRKSAQETRHGDGLVSGYYTLLDADGKQRLVRYSADRQRGFVAVVERNNH